ncbi:MAG: magnesium transporter CorA, partial [Burkholderiaceae bacterium]
MRIFTVTGNSVAETGVPTPLDKLRLPDNGYLWIACGRREFEVMQVQIQAALQSLCGMQLVDLHVSDLLSNQLPSHYDYTSQYDILVFRRLAAGSIETDLKQPGLPL